MLLIKKKVVPYQFRPWIQHKSQQCEIRILSLSHRILISWRFLAVVTIQLWTFTQRWGQFSLHPFSFSLPLYPLAVYRLTSLFSPLHHWVLSLPLRLCRFSLCFFSLLLFDGGCRCLGGFAVADVHRPVDRKNRADRGCSTHERGCFRSRLLNFNSGALFFFHVLSMFFVLLIYEILLDRAEFLFFSFLVGVFCFLFSLSLLFYYHYYHHVNQKSSPCAFGQHGSNRWFWVFSDLSVKDSVGEVAWTLEPLGFLINLFLFGWMLH